MHKEPYKLSRLTSAPSHEMPLFAASCHMAKKENLVPPDRAIQSAQSTKVAGKAGAKSVPNRMAQLTLDLSFDEPVRVPDTTKMPVIFTGTSIKAAISGWGDMSAEKRQNWAAAVSTAEKIMIAMERDPAGQISTPIDRWTCAHINKTIFAKPAAAHRLKERHMQNVVSNVRQVMMRLGRHAQAGRGRNELDAEWKRLYETLSQDRQRGIIRFFRFLSLHRMTPDCALQDSLESFAIWLNDETITDEIPRLVRRTASNWAWARTNCPGWPQQELRYQGMRDLFTTPLTKFPDEFQKDVELFTKGLQGPSRGDVFRDPVAVYNLQDVKRPRRRNHARSAATVKTRLYQIRTAAAALLHSGIPIESFNGLADLVTPPDRPRSILQFHLDRLREKSAGRRDSESEDPTSSGVSGIADLLRIVALHHAKLPEPEIDAILELVDQVRPERQTGMTEVVARKVRALNDPDVFATLMHLPDEWMKRLAKLKLTPRQEAIQAMYALALAIEIDIPLRRKNLVGLHLDKNLVTDSKTKIITGLDIRSIETKTRKNGIIFDFNQRLSGLTNYYIAKYRPILTDTDNRFLFPGLNGKHHEIGDFANELSTRVKREIGVDFHIHLMRHLAAYRILKRVPGSYDLASRILGHASTQTTIKSYCGLEVGFAVREASRLLELDKVQIKPVLPPKTSAKRRPVQSRVGSIA
jgi:integrase